jgi:hypothetical protein
VRALAGKVESWIGLIVPQVGLQLTWLNGAAAAFSAFAPQQPDGDGACVLTSQGAGGWDDRACGWPSVGNLALSPPAAYGYVCQMMCGNGTIDPGEECDPPGAGCTSSCKKPRACTEAGGATSPVTGRCYFVAAAPATYDAALSACPAGTHLATPNQPSETEVVLKVAQADSWIALRSLANANFSWDVPGVKFDARRYHGFVPPDPDMIGPACAVVTHGDPRGDGWRDRSCGTLYPAICERD